MLSKHNCFMLYGKLGVDFFSTSELLYPNMKFRLPLIGARSNFYISSNNPKVILGTVDFSLYTRRIALKDENHKKVGHARIYSGGVHLFGDSIGNFHHSRKIKLVHPKKN